jgi:hypothetical protein
VNSMFKVIVAGGRNFVDYALLEKTLDALLVNKSEVQIVSGLANGADKLGVHYARSRKLSLKEFPADWTNEGNKAGFNRNVRMAQYADACVCFWDGQSSGTGHMIRIAHYYKLQVRVIRYESHENQ